VCQNLFAYIDNVKAHLAFTHHIDNPPDYDYASDCAAGVPYWSCALNVIIEMEMAHAI
jgi:hypothetical protein